MCGGGPGRLGVAVVSKRENAPFVSSLAARNPYRSPSTQSVLPSLGATCVALLCTFSTVLLLSEVPFKQRLLFWELLLIFPPSGCVA